MKDQTEQNNPKDDSDPEQTRISESGETPEGTVVAHRKKDKTPDETDISSVLAENVLPGKEAAADETIVSFAPDATVAAPRKAPVADETVVASTPETTVAAPRKKETADETVISASPEATVAAPRRQEPSSDETVVSSESTVAAARKGEPAVDATVVSAAKTDSSADETRVAEHKPVPEAEETRVAAPKTAAKETRVAAPPKTPQERKERTAAWWQFPRRVIFLGISFGLAWLLQALLRQPLADKYAKASTPAQSGWDISWSMKIPVSEIINPAVTNALLLLGVALLMALVLAILYTLVAAGVHGLERKTGFFGSLLKALGRLLVFATSSGPAFFTTIVLSYFTVFQFGWLPNAGAPNQLDNPLPFLIIPGIALALYPALTAGQSTSRFVTLARERRGFRLWLGGLFRILGSVLGQTGGILSAAVIVEGIVQWKGLGLDYIRALLAMDIPVLVGLLVVLLLFTLVGRAAAELFRWLERLVSPPVQSPQPPALPWRRTARRIWTVLAILLIFVPLLLAAAGFFFTEDAATKVDVANRMGALSAAHLLGTDQLGRDVLALLVLGLGQVLGAAAVVALMVLIPALIWGALTGWLASRRTVWAETAADFLLIPADFLELFPMIAAVLLAVILLGPANQGDIAPFTMELILAVVLLPRAVRYYQAMWVSAPLQRRGLTRFLAGLPALFFGTLSGALGLVVAVDLIFLPPINLMSLIGYIMQNMAQVPVLQVIVVFLLPGICIFAFYTAADALVGFFESKEPAVHLNE